MELEIEFELEIDGGIDSGYEDSGIPSFQAWAIRDSMWLSSDACYFMHSWM